MVKIWKKITYFINKHTETIYPKCFKQHYILTRCRLALPFLPHSLSNAGLPMPGPASLDERLLNIAASPAFKDASSPRPQLIDAIPAELVSCTLGDSAEPSCCTPFNTSSFSYDY